MIVTRFAPSPTGMLHIGGARTALFSWLFARHAQGKFILRIEDTDATRSKQEYVDEILSSLQWLGMDYDEIFYQSKRFDIYREHANKLVREGKAYEKDGAVFFKYQFSTIVLDDLSRGKIEFNELPKTEEVIIKSDKSPTYNFACVVDDALLGVNYVIRGEDHISNTPKQILMYQALGFALPLFAHIPLIKAEGGGKMSKRLGATAITEYRQQGYLPEALVNYLMLLGWSPGENQEIISLTEATKVFEIKNVTTTAAAFSFDKLNWVNAHYIKEKSEDTLYPLVVEHLKAKNIVVDRFPEEYVKKIISIFKPRISRLEEIADWGDFCFREDIVYDEKAKAVLEKNVSAAVEVLKNNLKNAANFDKTITEEIFRTTAERLGLKTKELVHPVRAGLTGKTIGPGLFETMEIVGKEKTLQRLENLIAYWKGGDRCGK